MTSNFKHTISVMVISIFITYAASCSLTSVPEETPATENAGPYAGNGLVAIQLPMVPASFSQMLSQIEEKRQQDDEPSYIDPFYSGKAIGFVLHAEITIDDGINPLQTFSTTPGSASTDGYYSTSISLPEATGYTAYIKLYNTNMSLVDPTVTGYYGTFDITAGATTYIVIRPVPYAPVNLDTDTSESVSAAIPSEVGELSYGIETAGGEYWYEIDNAEYDFTAVTITHDDGDALSGFTQLIVFDGGGEEIARGYSPGVMSAAGDTPLSLNFDTEPGEDYYLVVFPFTLTGEAEAEFTITYTEGIAPNDDEYENNDEMSDATPIAQSAVINGICNDKDYFEFSLSDTANITIQCMFSQAEGDIDLYLKNDSDATIGSSDSMTDNEVITETNLPAGTYYILVDPFDVLETAYTLMWDIES